MRGAEPGDGAQSSAGTPEPGTQSPKLRAQIPVQLPSFKTQGAWHPEPSRSPVRRMAVTGAHSKQPGLESGYLSLGASAVATDRLYQQVLSPCRWLGRGPELSPDDSMGEEDPGVNRSSEIKKHPTRALKIKRSLCQRPGICW